MSFRWIPIYLLWLTSAIKENIWPQTAKMEENRCNEKNAEDLVIVFRRELLIKEAETGRTKRSSTPEKPWRSKKAKEAGEMHILQPHKINVCFVKPGIPGESMEVVLELKLLADVGLVGYPNVGKSTFISVVSEAKPNIANYHFTTLTPVLGVVRMEEGNSFVIADIPGLIEGAWEGVGLGHQFLRHVERCRMLVHVVDVSGSEGRDPKEDFNVINQELQKFNPELA